jgi:predicted transposase/invertase (TIGR01784 family)
MKTDRIFYRLFLEFPQSFFELIGNESSEATRYEFTSREVKQLAFRLDGLFLPTTNEEYRPFYLVEVQFQPEDTLYYRLFSELFLYLKQYQTPFPWNVVVIYPTRSIEREVAVQFGDLLNLNRVKRVYLDELGEIGDRSLGVELVKLVVEEPDQAVDRAKGLIQQAKQELTNEQIQRNLVDLIETIIVYKLPKKSSEDIEAMFGLSELKQTKVYQEAYLEGEEKGEQKGEEKTKLKAIPALLKEGLTVEQIARALDLPLAVVQQVATETNKSNNS